MQQPVVAKNQNKIQSRCLLHELSFTDIFNDINHVYGCGCLFLLEKGAQNDAYNSCIIAP